MAASSASGAIVRYHLNSGINNRGVAIKMYPELTAGAGWACLYKDNPLYKEITDLLLTLYTNNQRCTITWDGLRDGMIEIKIAESP